MMKTLRKLALWVFIFWLSGHVAGISYAENHALLIGIGEYGQRTLQGPAYDVQALSHVLSAHYDFRKKNVRTLVNEEAAKSRILGEMRRLNRTSRPGDHVFIYFSGHGTSRRDALLSLPLPHTSGALVPADFIWDSNQPIEDQLSQLIIGRRDLRPILTQLDRDRQVLVVFDTCFSGNTVRGIETAKSASLGRYFPLSSRSIISAENEIGSFTENLKPDEPYPYQNTFYISASTENETAKDIREDMLYLFPTIDGNPHGVLTDSLLRVLAGQAPVDTNNDGRWSQIEFYKAVKSRVQQRFRQTPQALPKEGENIHQLYDRSFFVRSAGYLTPASNVSAEQKQSVNIRLADELADLAAPVSQIEGIKIVDEDPDLVLIQDRSDIVLTLPNMHPLCRFTSFELQRLLDRIRRHQSIQPLIDLSYPQQQFNVYLELTGPYQKSIVREDEVFGVEIWTEKEAYLLLIDIDPAGAAHVLYPFDKNELRPIPAGVKKILAGKCRAVWPFGTETLKLFAFHQKPGELENLMGRQDIYPGSLEFEILEKMTGIHSRPPMDAFARNDVAQAVLQITSYAGTEILK